MCHGKFHENPLNIGHVERNSLTICCGVMYYISRKFHENSFTHFSAMLLIKKDPEDSNTVPVSEGSAAISRNIFV